MSIFGYEEKWVDKVDEDYFCMICSLVVRDAVTCQCGVLFCSECLKKWTNTSNTCPSCRQKSVCFPAPRDQRKILNLKITCPQKCNQIFKLREKQKHLDNHCEKRIICCAICENNTTPADLRKHQEDECEHRSVKCDECKQETTPAKLKYHQLMTCDHRQVMCPVCKRLIKCKNLETHLNTNVGSHMMVLVHRVRSLEFELDQSYSQHNGSCWVVKQFDHGYLVFSHNNIDLTIELADTSNGWFQFVSRGTPCIVFSPHRMDLRRPMAEGRGRTFILQESNRFGNWTFEMTLKNHIEIQNLEDLSGQTITLMQDYFLVRQPNEDVQCRIPSIEHHTATNPPN